MSVLLSNPKATLASGAVAVTEIDGAPSNISISTLKFSNGAVTDNGDGSVTVVTGVGGGGDVSSNTALSVDGEVVLFSGVGGKELKRSTLSGLLKSSSGVLQSATPGTDYLAINGNGSLLTGLSKIQVGLTNVDNTSDVNKPISTATQTVLDLKVPKAFPSFTGDIRSTLLATENFTIDAKTNARTITLGVFRIEHKAGVAGTRPITLDIDSNGFGNTRAMVINYLANGVSPGDESHLQEFIINTGGSTGGELQGISISKTGTGVVNVTALETLPEVHVFTQQTGPLLSLSQAWKLSGATYTDTTSSFQDGPELELFSLDNDYIICGSNNIFEQLDVHLVTESSNPIDAIFEYSTGPNTWTLFNPSDGTNGFTKSGTIMWPVLAGWTSSVVNGISKYYIRIQRTRNNISVLPVEDTITITSHVEFGWDKNAKVSVKTINATVVPVYADRTTAQTGGLITGDFYQTTAGVLMIV